MTLIAIDIKKKNPGNYGNELKRNIATVMVIPTCQKLPQLLQDLTYGFDLDIVCLTETWLNESISDFEILATGYDVYRQDRQNRTGGGVLIAIKSSLS